ncbi:EpsG family protein [Neobacillus drentensis]|uniref:EpsG family protein n=1 Tax=Neobacillus drentensis TaxID=220684 RepID=UPI002FFF47EB
MITNMTLLTSPVLIGINIYFFTITVISFFFAHLKRLRYSALIIGALMLMVVISTRDLSYGDAGTYYKYYVAYPNPVDIKFEFLFDKLIALSKLLGLSPELFFFITTAIQFALLFFGFYRLTKALNLEKYFEFIIYLFISGFTFYFQTVETIREGLALSIVVLAVALYVEGKLKSSIICLFISFLFHSSTIILLPLIFLRRISNKKLLILTTILLITSSFIDKYIVLLAKILNLNYILLRLELYRDFGGGSKTVLLRVILIFVSVIAFYFLIEKILPHEIENINLLKFYIYMSTFLFIAVPFQELARRNLFRFSYFIPFFVAIIIEKQEFFPKKKIPILLIILVGTFLYHNIFLQSYHAMVGLLNW